MAELPKSKAPGLSSRLTVLMVVDMVGYTLVMDQDESQAIHAINELRETYLEPVILGHNGKILKRMGDGWIITFGSVADQVKCAMEVQSVLAGHQLIKLRIGAHIGEIYEDENDFYGPVVNLAQRLQAESPPGGLMVSQDLHNQLPTELKTIFRDAGSFRLKNIAQPVNGFQWRPQMHPSGDTDREIKVADDVPSVFVQPFDFAPAESEAKAIADDLRDQIIERLSRRTGIRLLDEGAQSLQNATYQLQGRLRISGDRGRMNLKFILPAEGRTVLSQTYEGDTSDIFRFSDDLIEQVDSDLRLQINAFDGDRIAHLPDDALSISELRSRAASEFYQCTIESFERACHLMDQALRLNPSDAMALAMRAESKIYLAAARHEQLSEVQIRGLEDDLNMAVESAPRSDFVFLMRANFKIYITREISGAITDAERVLSLSPAYSYGHKAIGLAQLLAGEFDKASLTLQKAVSLAEVDPFLPGSLFELAIGQHLSGEHGDAIRTIDRAIQLRPRQWCFNLLRTICCRSAGDEAAASQSDAKLHVLLQEPSVLALRPPLPEAYREFADQFAPSGGAGVLTNASKS